MKKSLIIFISITLASILMGCESIDSSVSSENHPVITIDRTQATNLKCVYLYDTEVKETGWSKTSATSNSLTVIKNQVFIAGGNAIVITDIYSSEEYQYRYGDGYESDTARIYVDVYKCPFDENQEKID
tara:strand:- start:76 stop:462 length:387 start_codon:yes stop_codon:yes gene_type:complete